jgi:hypothetical protein
MSKILNRPMFRGGGKVSSYGNGIATGLADGGMPGKRGLVDGPGGYAGLDTKSGFRNSPAYKFGSAGLDAIGKVALDPLNYVANPVANAFNQGIVNPLAGLFGYGDLMKRVETPYDNKYLFGGEKFGESREYETDSGAIPKAILEAEKDTDKLTDSERRLEMENNELKKLLDSFGGSSKEDTEDEALAAIEKKQKLLEKVMGGGKSARIADASDMALNYASGALKEGATVKSSFADFFEKESSRPSRSQKVKDAAANAAIQAYLTEKISEKDFSKQMALITGQAQIKQKFANAAKSNLSVQDYVTARGASVSKSEAIENGARGMVENNDQYKSFEKIDSKDNVPELLVEENIGVVFLDSKTKEVFVVTVLEDGTVGKKVLYN